MSLNSTDPNKRKPPTIIHKIFEANSSFNVICKRQLLLIITLRFTCGERKICSTIKKSQNIMNMIVEDLTPKL